MEKTQEEQKDERDAQSNKQHYHYDVFPPDN